MRERESTFQCISTRNHFLNILPVAQTLREIINKWDLLELRSFCKAQSPVTLDLLKLLSRNSSSQVKQVTV